MDSKEETRQRLLRLVRRYVPTTENVQIIPPVTGHSFSTLIVGDRAARISVENGRMSLMAMPEFRIIHQDVPHEYPVRKTSGGFYIKQMLEVFNSNRVRPISVAELSLIKLRHERSEETLRELRKIQDMKLPRPTGVSLLNGRYNLTVMGLSSIERDAILRLISGFST